MALSMMANRRAHATDGRLDEKASYICDGLAVERRPIAGEEMLRSVMVRHHGSFVPHLRFLTLNYESDPINMSTWARHRGARRRNSLTGSALPQPNCPFSLAAPTFKEGG